VLFVVALVAFILTLVAAYFAFLPASYPRVR
jgi:hypothetical protein